MSAFSHRGFRYGVLAVGVLALTIGGLILSCQQSPPRRRLGFVDLQDRLHRHGIDVQVVSTRKDGGESDSVYLLAKDRDWNYLNVLSKNPARISEWDGVTYCERIGNDPEALIEQWGSELHNRGIVYSVWRPGALGASARRATGCPLGKVTCR
jgi:hypothetical protein